MSWWLLFPTALIPLVVGFIYYSKAVAGKAWMTANGFTDEDLQGGNMAVTLGLAYLCSILITMVLMSLVIHQFGAASAMMASEGFDVEGSAVMLDLQDYMSKYGANHRTFGHGALHGLLAGLLFAGGVIGTNALFEKKSFKYWMIHTGYWCITMALMGGVLCQFMTLPS